MFSFINQYKPNADDIWYHYCSANSFMSIIKNKTLRFCDLRHMNDKKELSYAEEMFFEMLNATKLSSQQRVTIETVLEIMKKNTVLLSMSFSKERDLLSQWRGYADNAQGFCIGFNAQSFVGLPAHLHKVEYNTEQQKRLIQNAISTIKSLNVEKLDQHKETTIAELLELFSIIKHYSFFEEQEYRLVCALFVDEDSRKGLFSLDADKEKYKNLLRPIDFRLVNNVPSPFVDVCFQSESEKNVIRQIIIGPKNSSSRVDLKLFLTTNGIYDVDVSKSASTYR